MYKSKAKPLNESIDLMSKALKRAKVEYKFNNFHNPTKNSYWVNLSSTLLPNRLFSNGKGSSKEAATASALGEFIERLQSNNFFNDFYLPNCSYYPDQKSFKFNDNYLNPKLRKFYNSIEPLTKEDLIDFCSDNFDEIISLPYKNFNTKEIVYFPVNILHNLYASNGLASGNSPIEAQVQAISEIIERYTKFTIIKNGYSLPKVPKEEILKLKGISSDIKTLQNFGYEVEVFDASLGGKFPVVSIALIDKKESSIFYSFGSHPRFDIALERTLTELLQGRDIDGFKNLLTPTFDLEQVQSSFNLESHFIDSNGKIAMQMLSSQKSFEYVPFSYSGNSIEDEHNYLVNLLTSLDKEIYIRDYNYLDFYSCSVLIPDFSEVYPVDDLIYNNSNQGKFIRADILNFKESNYEELLQELEMLDENIDLGEYIGVIFENSFSVKELKAQLYLLLNEYDLAIELLSNSPKKLHTLLVELNKLEDLELKFSNYQEALNSLFGKDLVKLAIDILSGKEFLINTTLSSEYQSLIKLYKDLSKVKDENFKS